MIFSPTSQSLERCQKIFSLVFLCALLSACSRLSGTSNSQSSHASELVMALSSDPPSLDPALVETGAAAFIVHQLVTTLFKYNEQLELVPYDAKAWSWSKDGRELMLEIHENLRWSDGKTLTACQFKAGMLHTLSPDTPSGLADLLFEIQGAAEFKAKKIGAAQVGIQCSDEARSLKLKVTEPFSIKTLHALAFFVSAPLREDLMLKRGVSWLLPDGEKMLGVSRTDLCVKTWTRNVEIVLTRCGSGGMGTQQIRMIVIPESNTAYAMYERGDLDILFDPPATLLPKLKNRSDFKSYPYLTTYMMGYGFKNIGILKDPKARRALLWTSGREELPALLQGGETSTDSWTPPLLLPEMERAQWDLPKKVEEAQKLWEEAKKSFPKNPKGGKYSIQMVYSAGDRHQLIAERMANNWKRHLDLNVELVPMEWKQLVSQLKIEAPQIFRYAWTAVYPDPLFFMELFESKSLNNFGQWKNADFDRLVQELRATPVSRRDSNFWKKYSQAQRILIETDPALIPVYHYTRAVLVKDHVQGFNFSPRGFVDLARITKN